MEELFLCSLLSALEEVNVIDQQEIRFPIAPAELSSGSIENGANKLVHELLGSYISDPGCWTTLKSLVCNCLHEMCLPQASITVDEERIVDLSRRLADRMSCRSGQFIRFSDYEEVESVALT